jgi:vWA-MoxR associated protein C-terminal domain/Effector-associated domain 2
MNSQAAQITEDLAEMLARVPAIMAPDGLDAILTMVRARGCDLPTPTGGNTRIVCYQLMAAASVRPGALQYLANAVRRLDGTVLGDSFADEVMGRLPSDFFALADRLKFVDEVSRLIRQDEIYMYYERVAGNTCLVPIPDAEALVRELEELIPGEKPSHPLVLLTEEIAFRARKRSARKTASELSDHLASLIDSWAGQERGGERSRLAELRKEKRKACHTSHDVEHATLTLMLDPYVPMRGAGYRLQVWMYRSEPQPEQRCAIDDPLPLSEIQREVVSQIDTVMRELSRPKAVANVDLEFILPRSMLGYAIEDWIIVGDHITLGTQFQVVVRDGDRLRHPILWHPWQEKWRRVTDAKAGTDAPISRWLTCLDAPRRAGEIRLELLGEEHVSFGLTFPPDLEAGRPELGEVLDAGVPVAVWPRGRCAHPIPARPTDICAGEEFRKNLCREMAGRPPKDIPRLVKEARQTRTVGDSGLALLWDDADRIPPHMQLDAPQYRRPNE